MVLTNDSMRGGKPNPGTPKDKRKKANKRSDEPGWAADLAKKSAEPKPKKS